MRKRLVPVVATVLLGAALVLGPAAARRAACRHACRRSPSDWATRPPTSC